LFDVQVHKAKVIVRFSKNQNKELPVSEMTQLDWEIGRPFDFLQGLSNAYRLIALGFPPDSIFAIKSADSDIEKQ
jgi:hypothetical protein